MRRPIASIILAALVALPAIAATYDFRAPVRFNEAVTFGSDATVTGLPLTTPTLTGAGAGVATLQYDNSANNRTYTFPDAGAAASVVMTQGTQTIAGATTFTLAPVLTSATLTANGDTITIQDLGSANLVQSEGAQTVNGVKTMGSANIITHANASGLKVLDTGGDHTIAITTGSDEAANRILTIPAMGAAATLALSSAAQTFTGVQTFSSAPVLSTATLTANGDTITIQDLGSANLVQTEGTQTINGAKTFSTAPTITGGLTAANIQTGSAKRIVMRADLAPNTGVAADATVYRQMLFPGRACTVKRIMYGTHVDPVSGTNVIKVLKAASGGNTMLNAASVTLNGVTADVGVAATLTGTGADLALTATQGIWCEYNAGTQGTDAEDVYVSVEIEFDDF